MSTIFKTTLTTYLSVRLVGFHGGQTQSSVQICPPLKTPTSHHNLHTTRPSARISKPYASWPPCLRELMQPTYQSEMCVLRPDVLYCTYCTVDGYAVHVIQEGTPFLLYVCDRDAEGALSHRRHHAEKHAVASTYALQIHRRARRSTCSIRPHGQAAVGSLASPLTRVCIASH